MKSIPKSNCCSLSTSQTSFPNTCGTFEVTLAVNLRGDGDGDRGGDGDGDGDRVEMGMGMEMEW